MSKDDASYEIGYSKPPQSTQFAKGQSGNPKGRPRGSRNLATAVLREARQQVRVNGPNGSRKVTKIVATLMQITNKAAQGDPRAARQLIALIQFSEAQIESGVKPESFRETDRYVLKNLLQRMREVDAASATPYLTEPKKEGSN